MAAFSPQSPNGNRQHRPMRGELSRISARLRDFYLLITIIGCGQASTLAFCKSVFFALRDDR